MIKEIASNISDWYYKKGLLMYGYSLEVYRYGFELLASTLINVWVLIIIGVVTNTELQAVMYCIGFVVLRIFAGGYHASTHLRCILIFNSSFLMVVIFDKALGIADAGILLIGLALVALTIVIRISPVGVGNKLIPELLRIKNRKISIAINILNLSLAIILYFGIFDNIKLTDIAYYFMGNYVASMFLIIARMMNDV